MTTAGFSGFGQVVFYPGKQGIQPLKRLTVNLFSLFQLLPQRGYLLIFMLIRHQAFAQAAVFRAQRRDLRQKIVHAPFQKIQKFHVRFLILFGRIGKRVTEIFSRAARPHRRGSALPDGQEVFFGLQKVKARQQGATGNAPSSSGRAAPCPFHL
jgi:hypothetical protein